MITEHKKCVVYDCPNHTDEGVFVGDICYPCHRALTDGSITRDELLAYKKVRRALIAFGELVVATKDLAP